jgi:hypothetical protein
MQSPRKRSSHIGRLFGFIERGQLHSQFLRMMRLDSGLAVGLVKFLKSGVAERLYHL